MKYNIKRIPCACVLHHKQPIHKTGFTTNCESSMLRIKTDLSDNEETCELLAGTEYTQRNAPSHLVPSTHKLKRRQEISEESLGEGVERSDGGGISAGRVTTHPNGRPVSELR